MPIYCGKINIFHFGTQHTYIYIPITLYHRKGSRGISDIPPRYPHFNKTTNYDK
jgi:hypothetical protein